MPTALRQKSELPRADLPIGVSMTGVVHTDREALDLESRFRMVAESGVFDYVERVPPPAEIDDYVRLSERYGVPIRACLWYYQLRRDEPLLAWHINVCRFLGAKVMNVQLLTNDAQGAPVSDLDVAEFYLFAYECAAKAGVQIAFETHVNMWSEHLGRVCRVGDIVESRGVPFQITLDHSHVIFKLENLREQMVQGMRSEVENGSLVLDPAVPGNVCDEWISRNYVIHAHARSAAPCNPINVLARHASGEFGRGIQYPFVQPAEGQWHSPWQESRLDAWKGVMQRLLVHHASDASSPLGQITCEFIPLTDYGAGASYSCFENNVAMARWLRSVWAEQGTQI